LVREAVALFPREPLQFHFEPVEKLLLLGAPDIEACGHVL
jgi:hypothetical protein